MSGDFDYVFCGWCGLSPETAKGQMEWQEYKPKPFAATDVDIKISHCGICGSDIHTLRSGWGKTPYPCVVGHEVIGRVVRAGSEVKHIQIGDRVGIGAQIDACWEDDCIACGIGQQQYCPRSIHTYNSKFPDGSITYGGYADYIRSPASFAFKIPDALASSDAAPMMCGGITMYSPLKNNDAGPGKSIGIVGLGGLGHFGVLFAKALGADKVVAISRSNAKRQDAFKLGADDFIATDEDAAWAKKHQSSLDLIISTVSSPNMPLNGYLRLLRFNGSFVQVGAPEDQLPRFHAFALIGKGCSIRGSSLGTPKQIEEMLQLAADRKIKPWIQERDMKDANKAVVDMEEGKARYRYVLVNRKNTRL